MAIGAGASALGLVGPMPSGPGMISDELIYQIAKAIPPPVGTFLLTSETSVDRIVNHYRRTHTNTIQLVDRLTSGTYSELRNAIPGIKLVQVIHVMNDRSIDEATVVSQQVDAILLDSGNPELAVKQLGGTGRTHNWDISRKIRDSVKIPVFLAGGLKPGNIRQAIEMVQPFGIDLCTGVRTNGQLDSEKLHRVMHEVLQSG